MLEKIFRAAAILASGTMAGQLFVVAISPIITRLYAPADFGIFGIYAAVLYMAVSVVSLRYEVAIPLTENESDAQCLVVISAFVVLVVSSCLLSAILILPHFYEFDGWKIFQYTLPVGVCVVGLRNVLEYYRLRGGGHRGIAKTRMQQAMGGAIVQVGGGLASLGAIGLIAGQIVGLSWGMFRMLSPSDYREIWRNFKFRNALRNVWEQKDFARYDAPAALSAIMNTHSATLIIGFVFSPASAGMYALVQRVLVTPLGIVSNVLATSLISHGREIKSGDQSAFQKSTAGALLVMSPILTVAALLMHYLFGVVFGKNWMIAGVVAAWVVLFVGQKFVFDSLFSLLLTQGKQKRGLALQASLLIARHSVLLVCSLFMNFQDSIAVFSLVSAIAYSYWGRTILRSSEIESFVGISLRWLDLLAPYAVVWVAINFNATMIEVVAAALIYFSWSGSRAYPVVASLSKMRPWKR